MCPASGLIPGRKILIMNTKTTYTCKDYARCLINNGTLLEVSIEYDTNKQKLILDRITYRLLTPEKDTLARYFDYKWYATQDEVDKAIRLIKKEFNKTKRMIKECNHPAIESMDKIANDTIKHYMADYTWHDKLTLARHNLTSFVWIVRPTGTHLIGWNDVLGKTIIEYDMKNSDCTFYLWDKGKMNRITANDALYELNYFPKE